MEPQGLMHWKIGLRRLVQTGDEKDIAGNKKVSVIAKVDVKNHTWYTFSYISFKSRQIQIVSFPYEYRSGSDTVLESHNMEGWGSAQVEDLVWLQTELTKNFDILIRPWLKITFCLNLSGQMFPQNNFIFKSQWTDAYQVWKTSRMSTQYSLPPKWKQSNYNQYTEMGGLEGSTVAARWLSEQRLFQPSLRTWGQ